jgi:hypothetical protein
MKSEYENILGALQTYAESIYLGDVARLRSVFHPRAALIGEVKGAPYYKYAGRVLGGSGATPITAGARRGTPHPATCHRGTGADSDGAHEQSDTGIQLHRLLELSTSGREVADRQ